MDKTDIWPLNFSNEDVRAQLMLRKRTSIRTWRMFVFWTIWYLMCMGIEVYWFLTGDTSSAKIIAGVFVGIFGALTYDAARRWDFAQLQADTATAAVASWDALVAKGSPRIESVRDHVLENAIQLQAAILVEQHTYEHLQKVKAAAKAAKRKGATVDNGEREPGE